MRTQSPLPLILMFAGAALASWTDVGTAQPAGSVPALGDMAPQESSPETAPAAPASQPAPKMPRPKRGEQRYVSVYFTIDPSHKAAVRLNGEEIYKSVGEVDTHLQPSALKPGKNTLTATFIPSDTAPELGESRLYFYLVTGTSWQKLGVQLLLGECEVERGDFAEVAWEFDFDPVKAEPLTAHQVEHHWRDEKHEQLTYEYDGHGDAFSEAFDEGVTKEWRNSGAPRLEMTCKGNSILHAKFYQADGSLGAEIKDGKGDYKDWDDEGWLAFEAPYVGGLQEGVAKTYSGPEELYQQTPYVHGQREGEFIEYAEGTIITRGRYKNDLKDGEWTRYSTEGAYTTVFKEGNRVSGEDDFSDYE